MLSKLLLSEIRSGDFTHAGGAEAINLVIDKFGKNQNQLLLDVGCGLGGTAKYIKEEGFSRIVGLDANPDTITYAKNTYPDIEFYHCDVINVVQHFERCFDIVYLFNSFYAFKLQPESLLALSQVSNSDAKLIIFDYFSLDTYTEKNPFYTDGRTFLPINKNNIANLLYNANWQLDEFVCLTDKYKQWYLNMINSLDQRKLTLIPKFGKETFNRVYTNFTNLIDLMVLDKLGGCIIIATRVLNN